jgi:hypothetical protein
MLTRQNIQQAACDATVQYQTMLYLYSFYENAVCLYPELAAHSYKSTLAAPF